MQQQMRPPVGFADLERWPEDGKRYELYDGEVVVIPTPTIRHQRVAQKIGAMLIEYERATNGLAVAVPIDIVFDEYNAVQPDVVFFTPERAATLDHDKVTRIPPDLAVEVLSPGTKAIDRGRKKVSYQRFGVREYWIVDPRAKTVEQYVLRRGHYVLHATVSESGVVTSARLSGLSFPAAQIFGF